MLLAKCIIEHTIEFSIASWLDSYLATLTQNDPFCMFHIAKENKLQSMF